MLPNGPGSGGRKRWGAVLPGAAGGGCGWRRCRPGARASPGATWRGGGSDARPGPAWCGWSGVDEAIDGLVGDDGLARLPPEPASDLLWRPAVFEAGEHPRTERGIPVETGAAPAPGAGLPGHSGAGSPAGGRYCGSRAMVDADPELICRSEAPWACRRASSHRSSIRCIPMATPYSGVASGNPGHLSQRERDGVRATGRVRPVPRRRLALLSLPCIAPPQAALWAACRLGAWRRGYAATMGHCRL